METRNGGPADGGFRDTLGIVSREGKRKWIYPKRIVGRFYRARTLASVILLAVLFGLPLVRVDGHPFLLFNVLERKFIIFGGIFGPHDFYLFGLALITLVVFIILFTVVFGRLFCGWVCPQTVVMEMVFRKIDYLLEGDHHAQARLNASPWTGGKLLRKGAKHAVYFAIAFLIANTLAAYVVGTDRLFRIVTEPPSEHLAGLTAVLGFSILFHWIFAWFREQACILVCPYGRLQGVLLDRSSVVIAYDHVRGEPRGKLRRGQERTEGDCIDCDQCVEVCPTGIDIRNGTQLECVNCTACIDACDMVMDRIGRPRGLVRYDSAEGIEAGKGLRWTPRAISYSAALVAMSALLLFLLAGRTAVDVTILRTPGMFYQEQPDGRVSNVYDFTALNKTLDSLHVTLRLVEPAGQVEVMGGDLVAAPQRTLEGKLIILLQRESLRGLTTPLTIEISGGGQRIGTVATSFLGPGAGR